MNMYNLSELNFSEQQAIHGGVPLLLAYAAAYAGIYAAAHLAAYYKGYSDASNKIEPCK